MTYLNRMGAATKEILWTNRSHFSLRTMKIFANRYFETLIPNPKAKKWQHFAELLIPILIANAICYVVSKNNQYTSDDFINNTMSEILLSLVMVRLFFEKNSLPYWCVNIFAILSSFWFAKSAAQAWDEVKKENPSLEEDPLGKRAAFVKRFWGNSNTFHSVIADGVFDIVFYTLLDDFIMPHMKVPKWLRETLVEMDVRDKKGDDA